MKFPRNTRLLRSPFEVAPFAAVFFLLILFLMLGTLLPTPGLRLELPVSSATPGLELPGADQPTLSVALAAGGRYYFDNQTITEGQLKASLATAATNSRFPLTLVIQADKAVTYDELVHVALLARDAGILNAQLATLPRLTNPSAKP